MASLRSKANILHLPPAIRASIQQRCFSSTPARQASITDVLVAPPTALLDTVHSIGIPWWAAIPISAAFIRGTLGYYFAALPARKKGIIRQNLFPLAHSTADRAYEQYRKKAISKFDPFNGNRAGLNIRLRMMQRWILVKTSHTLGKAFGAPLLSVRGFFNFGMLIAFSEALRIKCGVREGLLTLITRPLDSLTKGASGDAMPVDPRANMTPDEILVQRLEAAREAQNPQEGTNILGSPLEPTMGSETHLPRLDTSSYADYLDPTLQTEGLSWCQDLTLPDTTFILPASMSLIMIATAILRPSTKVSLAAQKTELPPKVRELQVNNELQAALAFAEKMNPEKKSPTDVSTRLVKKFTFQQRIALSMAIVFFFVGIKLPAAIILYIVPSMAIGWLQSRWLDLKYPLPEPIMPCRRPVRIKVRRAIGDA